MRKVGSLMTLGLALCLPLAAMAAQLKAPPKVLDTLESHAEDAIDHAARRQWNLVRNDAQATVSAWHSLRPELARQNVPQSTIQSLDQRIAAFQRAATAATPNQLAVEQRANSVTALVPDLQAHYQAMVPIQVSRLDYLGRQVQLDNQANQSSQAGQHAGELRATWNNLRAQAKKVAPDASKAIDRDVAQIEAHPTSKTAVLASKDLLDKVDELENGFMAASVKSTGGGAGSAPKQPPSHRQPKNGR